MEITIEKVAKRTGVSVSTASRILNGGTKGMRRDAVLRAQRVIDAAREMGYYPNPVARGLVMKRTFTLGFIGTELNNPVRSTLIETLRIAAQEKGYHLLVSGIKDYQDVPDAIRTLIMQRVDGLVLGNIQSPAAPVLAEFAPALPVVSFGQETDLPWDCVTIDYGGMTEKLTAHLIKHRRKKIIFIGPDVPYPRRDGYEKAMRQAGLDSKFKVWSVDEFTLESGRRRIREELAAGHRPDGIVCHNDLLAIGVIAGLRDAGLTCPCDIAVTGLDDIDMAEYTNPTLTTAGIDSTKLARRMFDLLHARIDNNDSLLPQKVAASEHICFRESCGCVRSR